jgi:HAD superfamily hydrolase (TIGR01509 family)
MEDGALEDTGRVDAAHGLCRAARPVPAVERRPLSAGREALGSAGRGSAIRTAMTAVGDHREPATLSPVARPVVFDMDGVLVDSEPLYEAAFRACMGSVGRPELGELFSITLGGDRPSSCPSLPSRCGSRPRRSATASTRAAEALMEAELVVMPHARAAVERVAAGDRRVGLASSSIRAFIDRVLQTLGIAERFATIVSGDEVARGKPYPEIYRGRAASRLEVAPQHCVAIEDTRLASAPPRRLA